MADQIISLLLEKLVGCIAVPVGRQFSYLLCYNGNLENYKNQIKELETLRNAVKQRVEADERNGKVILESVKKWLAKVDAASDESRHFVEEEEAITKRCFNAPLNLKVRYQRSRKAKKKALEFDAIRKDGIFTEVAVARPPQQIWSAINENEYDFESRRSIFNELKEAVKADGVGMIGIWGMPGIGKTTLVKRVAKYTKDESLFEAVAMAVVSQNPNVKAIQGQIADEIGLKLTNESDRGRAGELLQCLLAKKKIMIVLDDIWDRIELNDLGIPSGSQHKGCKIILTTRKRSVCEEMGTGKIFTIDLLSENEALDLFLHMSGVNDRSSELGRLAEKLSEECGRLPISIVIVARGLANKPKGAWEDMLNRLRKSDSDRKVQASIELSYNNLDCEEEQRIFLLCALFPEDYKIPVQVLFEYGLSLNLFERVDNLDEAAVRAHNLASRLKSQCLLLDEGDDEFVKMHDVIRDAALVIASKGKHVFLVQSKPQWREWSKKTAISLWSNDVKKLPDTLECPQLQILMLNYRYSNLQLHDNFFAGMKNLVVLDVSDMEFIRLPQSFASLENLQTLRLNACKLGDISAIGKLQNLVSLSLCDSKFEVLPKEVGQLSNMRFLDFSNCHGLEVITPGVIQNLSQLEVLLLPNGLGTTILSEFKYLTQLIVIDVCITDASMLPDDVLFQNLTKFQVSIGKFHYRTANIFSSSSQILELTNVSKDELSKSGIKMLMKKAHHMKLANISRISVALPSPLGEYVSLKELIINSCVDINYVLDMSGSEYEQDTPSLQLLHLINLPSLKEIVKGKFSSLLFSKLEHLKLDGLPSLVRLWSFQAESNLTTMKVTSCDKLEYVFDHDSAKGLSKLKKLKVRNCINLEAICLSKEEDDDIMFPQLSHLELSELKNLASFGSKSTSGSILFGKKVKFPIFKSMHVAGLKSVKKIWHDNVSTECFSQLQRLYVSECDQLVEVFPSHLKHGGAKDLSKLEELEVKKCKNLEAICQSNEQDEDIVFPKLSSLKLLELENLTLFGPKFTSGSTLFGEKVNFPILENMHMDGLKSLKKIWQDNVSTECFSQLQELYISECDQLVEVFPCHLAPNLNCLEQVTIKQCCFLGGKGVLKIIATLPKLKNLELHLDHEPIELRESLSRYGGFQSLTSLEFSYCNGLKSLSTPSTISVLAQLQNLYVGNCESMESIIGEGNFDKSIEFSKLENLTLDNLPHLASFYNGACDLKFPCLYNLSIKSCPKLKTLASMSTEMSEPSCLNFVSKEELFGQQVSFGTLRNLKLEGLELIEEIWHCDHATTTVGELSYLGVEGCDRLLKIFPSNLGEGLQNVKYLYIKSCRSLEHVFAVEHHPPLLSKLEYLELEDLPELKQLWWNKNSGQSFGLQSLYGLVINTCPTLEFIFDPSVGNCLENLTALVVSNCSSMVEIVAEKPGKKIDFPLLYSLELVNLPCFKVKQDVEFPGAKFVSVDQCFNMKERRGVAVKKDLAAPVRYFESFVELMKTELDSSTSASSEEDEVIGDDPSQHEPRDDEVEGVAENSGCDR